MLNRTEYERPGCIEWIDPASNDTWMSRMDFELYGGMARRLGLLFVLGLVFWIRFWYWF
jgi:hypothetical protein